MHAAGIGCFGDCVCCSDMVHRPGWSSVCGCIPTGPDAGRRHHGLHCLGRTVLPGRVNYTIYLLHQSVHTYAYTFQLIICTLISAAYTYVRINKNILVNINIVYVRMCSIIGAVLIIAGLYLVLWGKSQERAFAIKEAATRSVSPSACDHDSGLQRSAAPTLTTTSTTTSFKASSLTQPLMPSENV